MELVIRTRGHYDELELLFSEAFPDDVQQALIERLNKVRGVETGAATRYSIEMVVAPHVAKVEAVADDVVKLFKEPELRSLLNDFGVSKIRVVRGEGDNEFLLVRDRTTEV